MRSLLVVGILIAPLVLALLAPPAAADDLCLELHTAKDCLPPCFAASCHSLCVAPPRVTLDCPDGLPV